MKEKEEQELVVEFTTSAFRYNRMDYNSDEVRKLVEAGDQEALRMVAELVRIGSGVIRVLNVKN